MGFSCYTYCHRHRRFPWGHSAGNSSSSCLFLFVLFLSVQPQSLHCSLLKLNDSRWILEDKNGKVAFATVLSTNETFFPSKLGTYMLNFVRICSTLWERHGFSLQNPGRVPYFGLSDENGSEELFRHSQACHTGCPPRLSFRMKKMSGWRLDAEVKNACYSFRGLEFGSQHTHPTTVCNSSCRDFQHSLLGSAGTCTHAQTCRHI